MSRREDGRVLRPASLVALVMLVAACGPSRSGASEAPAITPAAQACQVDGMPQLPAMIEIDHGADGVLVLGGGTIPDDPDSMYVVACRVETSDGQTTDAGSSGGTVPRRFEDPIILDASLVVDGPAQKVLAGRIRGDVARVGVQLADGTVIEAAVRNGYWLAWWSGPLHAVSVRALGPLGDVAAEIPASRTPPLPPVPPIPTPEQTP
jgi:hypothetical protein